MEYRALPHGGEQIGTIGIGLGTVKDFSPDSLTELFTYAIDHDINFFDLCAGHVNVYAAFGRASAGRRDRLITQMHFGAAYEKDGLYGVTRDIEVMKRTFEHLLADMGTGYTDMGYFHCVDQDEHVDFFLKGGVLDYVLDLKRQGLVRHVGFSSHTPSVARKFLETGLMDMCMFSINPAYDYQKGNYGYGAVDERAELYRLCESLGVGISVMKPFGAGQLLDAKTSPLGIALTRDQCLRYALDRPAVLTVVPGVSSRSDIEQLLTYYQAAPEDTDYSIIGTVTPESAEGRCVYCNHCQPCPAGIDIGLVNKYYDLAKVGDELARSHYQNLGKAAGDCIGCGHCERQCPFGVKQVSRMQAIHDYFTARV